MNKQQLKKVDEAIYRAERAATGWIFLTMSAVVFVDVVHRVFSRAPGRVAEILGAMTGADPEKLDTVTAPALAALVTFALVYGALRTRESSAAGKKKKTKRRSVAATAAIAGGVTIGASLVVGAFTRFVPQGVVWAPYFGLSGLLWIGLLGASMAAHQGSHLALEMGDKLWPKNLRPIVKTVSQTVTALFCLMIAALGAMSIGDHFADWKSAEGAGLLPSIDWPKWLVFIVIPYAFAMIALRFGARAAGLLEQVGSSEIPVGIGSKKEDA